MKNAVVDEEPMVYITMEDSIRYARLDDLLQRIGALYVAWANGDEPEGAPSARRTLLGIGEVLGVPARERPEQQDLAL